MKAGMGTEGASVPVLEDRALTADRSIELQLLRSRLVGKRALGADPANKSLRQHADHRRGHHERFDSHLKESVDGADRVGRVQGREHEVTRERGLHGALGQFLVTVVSDYK